jgi:predicted phosphodiesterase
MTRLAVLADIHGNLPALNAVVHDMAAFDVDQVVVAGDSINWGPFSVQVMERIFDSRWSLIRGNHEFYMLDYNTPRAHQRWQNFCSPRWLNQHIPQTWRNIIAGLPDEINLRYPDAHPVKVVHASPGDHWKGIYPTSTSESDIHTMLNTVEESTVITGHTHLQMQRFVGKWQILNPGSVGVPLNGDPRAEYMIIDGNEHGWTPTFRLVEYDRRPLFEEYERIGFVESRGAVGLLMIEEVRHASPLVYSFQKWRQRVHNGAPETFDLAREFMSRPIDPQDRHPEYHTNDSLNHLFLSQH